MTKSLYSLILTDEVVRRIDKTAEVLQTSRSNLINEILADYVSYITPEKKIQRMFEYIAEKMSDTPLKISSDFSGRNLAFKSSLDYKYKPTITYNVKIFRSNTGSIGEMKVIYRIHSQELLYKIESFFKNFMIMESNFSSNESEYSISDGKFCKIFLLKDDNYSQEEIAMAISDYIKNFDTLLRKYLSNQYYDLLQMEQEYKEYMSKSIII